MDEIGLNQTDKGRDGNQIRSFKGAPDGDEHVIECDQIKTQRTYLVDDQPLHPADKLAAVCAIPYLKG